MDFICENTNNPIVKLTEERQFYDDLILMSHAHSIQYFSTKIIELEERLKKLEDKNG